MFGFAGHNDEQTEDKNLDIMQFLTEKFGSFDARFDKLEGRVNSLAQQNNQERFSLAVEEGDIQKSNRNASNLRGNNKTIYLDEISVKAFVGFCKEVHILQVKNKSRVSISSFISNRVINFLIKRGSLYYYGLDGAMFKNLSLDSIQRLMRESMKPKCKDDFISTVDELVQFPRLPQGYLLSVYGFELFYKALCEYMRCFLELVQFLLFDEAYYPSMLNNRRGSLLHVFMNKIPFNYGHQCLKQLGRETFTSVHEMVDEFLSVWDTDVRRANEEAWTSVDEDFAVEILAVTSKEIENYMQAEVVSDDRPNYVCDAQPTDSNSCGQYGQAVSKVSITEDQTVKMVDSILLRVAPIESSPGLSETADSNSKTMETNESNSDLSSCQFVGFQVSRGNSSDAVSIVREVFSVCKTSEFVSFVNPSSELCAVDGHAQAEALPAADNVDLVKVYLPVKSFAAEDVFIGGVVQRGMPDQDRSEFYCLDRSVHLEKLSEFTHCKYDMSDLEVSCTVEVVHGYDSNAVQNGPSISIDVPCPSVNKCALEIREHSLRAVVNGPGIEVKSKLIPLCISSDVINGVSVVIEELSASEHNGKSSSQYTRKIFSATYEHLWQLVNLLQLSVRWNAGNLWFWSHASGLTDVMSNFTTVYTNSIHKDFVVMIEPEPPPFILDEQVVPEYTAQTNIIKLLRTTWFRDYTVGCAKVRSECSDIRAGEVVSEAIINEAGKKFSDSAKKWTPSKKEAFGVYFGTKSFEYFLDGSELSQLNG